jgi:hypothetical protein
MKRGIGLNVGGMKKIYVSRGLLEGEKSGVGGDDH